MGVAGRKSVIIGRAHHARFGRLGTVIDGYSSCTETVEMQPVYDQ